MSHCKTPTKTTKIMIIIFHSSDGVVTIHSIIHSIVINQTNPRIVTTGRNNSSKSANTTQPINCSQYKNINAAFVKEIDFAYLSLHVNLTVQFVECVSNVTPNFHQLEQFTFSVFLAAIHSIYVHCAFVSLWIFVLT